MADKDFVVKNGLTVTNALRVTPSSINLSTGLVGTTASFSGALVAGATTLTGALSGTTATFSGSLTVSTNNATGGGIVLADDGDIVDMNTGYAAMRFTSGVQIYSAKRGGSPVITLASNGDITSNVANISYLLVRPQNDRSEGGEIHLMGAGQYNGVILDNLNGAFRAYNASNGAGVTFNLNQGGMIGKSTQLARGGNINDVGMTFNWAGQGGQPAWVWGGNDGINMYVWNPGAFSVSYANNAGAVNGSALSSGTIVWDYGPGTGNWWNGTASGLNPGAFVGMDGDGDDFVCQSGVWIWFVNSETGYAKGGMKRLNYVRW